MDTKTETIQAYIVYQVEGRRNIASRLACFGTPQPTHWQRITKYKVGDKDGVGLGKRGEIVRVFQHTLDPSITVTIVTDPTDSEIFRHKFDGI